MIKKMLAFVIIFLFMGPSVISSTGNIVEDIPFNIHVLAAVDCSENLLLSGKTAYAYIANPGSSGLPEGPCFFALNDPGNITSLKPTSSDNILTGGTWSTDARWRGCEYGSGCLWEIDHETGDMWSIGGGGIHCNGLSWHPFFTKLYATDGSNLIVYDIETGEQTLIGSHSQPGKIMIALAINLQGVCYTWDIVFSGDSTLYTVNLDDGQATEVASMGENLYGAGDGAFDWDTGILYLSDSGQLKTCDLETGELTLVGDFEGGAELTALAIPWYWGMPQADFIWTPSHPNPGEMILFNASDSYDPDGYITLYQWDWNNDGVFDENHTSPTATHTFEEVGYYPVTLRVLDNDNIFNRTNIKTKTVRVGNYPPDSPIISGPTHGKIGVEYGYNFSLSDPDHDAMYLRVDWGNGTAGPWQGPYDSGKTVKLNHSWDQKGTFTIRAQAKDIYGAESDWGTLKVTMPKNQQNSQQFSNSLFFQIVQRLLNIR